jgi:hypothetical protein
MNGCLAKANGICNHSVKLRLSVFAVNPWKVFTRFAYTCFLMKQPMQKISLLFLSSFLTLLSFSQNNSFEKIEKAANRFIYTGNVIRIFDGQRICILSEKDADDGSLKNFQLADSGSSRFGSAEEVMTNVVRQNNEKNICIDYKIVPDKNRKSTYLVVNNPYKQTLYYKAKIFSVKTNTYVETSIYPVEPGISGIEHWPYAIDDIVLYDFVLKSE